MLQKKSLACRFTYIHHILFVLLLALAGGCARAPVPPPSAEPAPPPTKYRELRSTDYVVLTAVATDTYESIARHYLGDEKLAYLISEYNKDAPIVGDKMVIVPLQPQNPGGLYPDGYQTVPVLCYHKFSTKKSSDKITVSSEMFDRQMTYLKNNGYTVITLKQFYDFLEYRRRPPKKSVLITIDDGWKTVKTIAYPILKKYGFPAVLFINTSTIKENPNTSNLTWDELRELNGTGLFEVETHTITHDDLTKVSDEQLQREMEESQRTIKSMIGTTTTALAYPYGLFNRKIIEVMKKYDFKAGFTVIRGGNAFFYSPYALNRSMIYHSDRIEDFVKSLQTFRQD